uniref:PRO0715 n=1 Tax=Homo sapiens TaxID=9606 RepID=Q96JR6_HUMAN|nr:PRO0715 [Homo sapiens]
MFTTRFPKLLIFPKIVTENCCLLFCSFWGWWCWLGHACEVMCVSDLTDSLFSLLIERALFTLFICFDTSAFSVLS